VKVSSNPESLGEGDVLYAKERFFRVMSAPQGKECTHCCLRNENCHDYVGSFCPITHYYRPAQITPKIERALDIALLQGEVFAGGLR